MRPPKFILIFVGLALSFTPLPAAADREPLTITVFYLESCVYCHQEMEFFQKLTRQYPQLKVVFLEITLPENMAKFNAMAESYGTNTKGVPKTFFPDKVFVSFNKKNGPQTFSEIYQAPIGYKNILLYEINRYLLSEGLELVTEQQEQSADLLYPLLFFLLIPLYLLVSLFILKVIRKQRLNRYWATGFIAVVLLSVFLFMLTFPQARMLALINSFPFPLFVLAIALVDGFNPCAFAVLFILLSLLTYTKNKGQMYLIGSVFIAASGLLYFLFTFLIIYAGVIFFGMFGKIFSLILGLPLLLAGAVNIKDFFWFKKGFSLSLNGDSQKRFSRMARKIVLLLKNRQSLALGVLLTLLLAVLVNLAELGCTAVLPAVYMDALVTRYGLKPNAAHVLWTFLYAGVYVIPLFIILVDFIIAFKSRRIDQQHGRNMKLAAGLLMILGGFYMMFH